MSFKQTPHPIHPELTDREMLSIAESKGVEFCRNFSKSESRQ